MHFKQIENHHKLTLQFFFLKVCIYSGADFAHIHNSFFIMTLKKQDTSLS